MSKMLAFSFLAFFISIKSFSQGRLNGGDFCEDKITSILTSLVRHSSPPSGISFDHKDDVNSEINRFYYKLLLVSDKKKCEQIPEQTIKIINLSDSSKSTYIMCIHPETCKKNDLETIAIINQAIREFSNIK